MHLKVTYKATPPSAAPPTPLPDKLRCCNPLSDLISHQERWPTAERAGVGGTKRTGVLHGGCFKITKTDGIQHPQPATRLQGTDWKLGTFLQKCSHTRVACSRGEKRVHFVCLTNTHARMHAQARARTQVSTAIYSHLSRNGKCIRVSTGPNLHPLTFYRLSYPTRKKTIFFNHLLCPSLSLPPLS